MWFSIVINQSKQLRYFSELTLGYVHTTMPYWEVFAPARKPYQIGSLLTHKNGDCRAISETEQCCAALIFKVDSHCLLYQIAFRDCTFSSAPQRSFWCRREGREIKKSAVYDGNEERERERDLSLFPSSTARLLLLFIARPRGASREKRVSRQKAIRCVN